MKTKVNFNHRIMMGLLVMGSILSMVISSAFTTTSAWSASLAQSGSTGIASMSGINPALLPMESKHTHNSAKHQREKNEKQDDQVTNTSYPAPLEEVTGTVSDFRIVSTSVGPRALFDVNGIAMRLPASQIVEFTISNGDSVTMEGYFLGPNELQVTEVERAQ